VGAREDCLVEAVHHRGHGAVLAREAPRQLLGRPRPVLGVVLDFELLRQPRGDFVEDAAGDEHPLQLPYRQFGSQRVIDGQRYMITMQMITITMYGIMPANIWFSVTWGGDTPLR